MKLHHQASLDALEISSFRDHLSDPFREGLVIRFTLTIAHRVAFLFDSVNNCQRNEVDC